MVDSKKDYDDIGRKEQENEINEIKNNPEALQARTAAILSKASPNKTKLGGLNPIGATPGNAKNILKLDPLAAPVAAKTKNVDVVKPIGTTDRPKVMNNLEERAESPIKPIETSQTREEGKGNMEENPFGSDDGKQEKSSPVKEPTTSKEKDAEELEELLDELESDEDKPKVETKVESPPQEPVFDDVDALEESLPQNDNDEMEEMLRKAAENNNPNEVKKTEKIISNQPVDDNEFSYFNKEKKAGETKKPKMEGADDDDLNLFSNAGDTQTKKTSRDAANDSFDFEF